MCQAEGWEQGPSFLLSGSLHPWLFYCRILQHKRPHMGLSPARVPQLCLYFHSEECRGWREPSPCPVSSSEPCRPANTNIGAQLLNFPGPGAHRAAPVLPLPGQGPGWGCAHMSL